MRRSFSAAIEGVVHALKAERNMRIHFLLGALVTVLGIYLQLNYLEFMILCFAVSFVLVSEMFNTVVEHSFDLLSDEYHPKIKIIKDISAGAVFVSSVNAAVVGYILFFRRVAGSMTTGFGVIKQSPWHITFIILIVVIALVLAIKIIRREKDLLHGGMPSGHSAVAFAVWMVVTLVTSSPLVSLLVFLLAFIIARSRKVSGTHTIFEVTAGSAIGAAAALLIYQILQ
jgi:diacylglycerol kinase (ATP)